MNAGVVRLAAAALNVSRSTLHRWIVADPLLRQAVASVRETLLDIAESVLWRQIQAGNVHAVIFFLRTHGKDRGYTTRIEPRRLPPPAPETGFDLSLLREEDKKPLLDILNKAMPARH